MKNKMPKSKLVNNAVFVLASVGILACFFPYERVRSIYSSPASNNVQAKTFENLDLFKESILLDQDLEGKWKFSTGDNSNWKEPAFNDDDWNEIYVPGYWEHQGYAGYNGMAWYRKDIQLNESLLTNKLVLLLGKIDDIDQVYVNGQLVGFTGEGWNKEELYVKGTEWQELRGYYLPEGIFKADGKNVICIRVYDGLVDGGIHEGPIGLITQKNYIEYWRQRKQSNNKNRF